MENNKESNLVKQNTGFNEAQGSGVWSSLFFMVFAILVMFLLRYFLNY